MEIEELWSNLTAFYFVDNAPVTNNPIENYYSTSLKTHRNLDNAHDSLKLEINLNMEKVKFNSNPKKWIFQTPAMVGLIIDHIWTMKKLITWRAPVQ